MNIHGRAWCVAAIMCTFFVFVALGLHFAPVLTLALLASCGLACISYAIAAAWELKAKGT